MYLLINHLPNSYSLQLIMFFCTKGFMLLCKEVSAWEIKPKIHLSQCNTILYFYYHNQSHISSLQIAVSHHLSVKYYHRFPANYSPNTCFILYIPFLPTRNSAANTAPPAKPILLCAVCIISISSIGD